MLRHLICATLVPLLLPIAASAAPGQSQPAMSIAGADAVATTTLANGMKVIVWTDRDIPNIALYNWVRVGSRNEVPGITGLAHFFEHMMFNGTSRREPGEFDRQMEALGGSNNAFTSDDVTVYQDWIPRTALEAVFDLEADRLANLAFVQQVIDSERNVVFSERRMRVEDSNDGYLSEQMQATAFVAHPYAIPTLGWPSDIRAWQIEDLQKFFKTYYSPNNCTLVVVGDVAPEEVFALARKYLEPIPRQQPPAPLRTVEPEQSGEKRVLIERRAQTPLLQLAYKAPNASDPRMPALNLLQTILVGGDASRLHRLLVEQEKLAISVSGYLQEGFDPGLFWLALALPEGTDPAQAEAALDAELEKVVRDGVTEAELDRAKNLTLAGLWRGLATINGKARLLGEFDVFHGDHQKLFTAPADYDAVTLAAVQSVAAEVLQRRSRTVGVLVPKSPVPRSDASVAGAGS
ncbi:MAG: insulinase family protein [Proteobacteria bacterium]|nr:insulinase family protein [Pseudomonadota bacterium]